MVIRTDSAEVIHPLHARQSLREIGVGAGRDLISSAFATSYGFTMMRDIFRLMMGDLRRSVSVVALMQYLYHPVS